MSATESKVRLRIRTDRNDRFLLVASSDLTIDELSEQIKSALIDFSSDSGHKYYDPSLRIASIANITKEDFCVRGSDRVGDLFLDQDVISCDVVLKTKDKVKGEKEHGKQVEKARGRLEEQYVVVEEEAEGERAEKGDKGHKKQKKDSGSKDRKQHEADGKKPKPADQKDFDLDAIVKGLHFEQTKHKSKPQRKSSS